MASSRSSQQGSLASSSRSPSELSRVRRERKDTVLSTYLPLGHPARSKAITSSSQLFLPNTTLDGPSSSVPQLDESNNNAATGTGATSTRPLAEEETVLGVRIGAHPRSFSENDLSNPTQGPSSLLHPASPSVYVPTGTPTWIEDELNTLTRPVHRPFSSLQGSYEASINTVTELSVDPHILSGSTSVMSGSSSDFDFEMYARQGTWDSGSDYGKRVIMWNWVRRCGEGFTKVRVGMKRKCKKWMRRICSTTKKG